MSEMDDRKIALFDLDNTLAGYNEVMEPRLAALRHPQEPIESQEGDEPAYMQARRRAISQDPLFWRHLPLLQDGKDLWDLQGELGFRRKVLTQGPTHAPVAWAEKLIWVQDKLGPDIPTTITRDKSETYGRVLNDDWPPYCRSWLQWRPRGLVVLVDRPWNRDFQHPQVLRYDGTNIDEVRRELIKARDRKSREAA